MTAKTNGKAAVKPTPATQALTSKTFSLPPLDGTLTVPELLDFHYKNSGSHPVFIYDDAGTNKTVYWSEWVPAIHRAARHIRKVLDLSEPETAADRPVVAVLANSGQRLIFYNI